MITLISKYQLSYPEAFDDQEAFMKFVGYKVKETLFSRLSTGFYEDSEIKFEVISEGEKENKNPSKIKRKEMKKLVDFLDNISKGVSNDTLDLNEKPDARPDTVSINISLKNDMFYIVNYLHVFPEGENFVFGINDLDFFKDSNLTVLRVLRDIEAGNVNHRPYPLFSPIFSNFRKSLTNLYKVFIGRVIK